MGKSMITCPVCGDKFHRRWNQQYTGRDRATCQREECIDEFPRLYQMGYKKKKRDFIDEFIGDTCYFAWLHDCSDSGERCVMRKDGWVMSDYFNDRSGVVLLKKDDFADVISHNDNYFIACHRHCTIISNFRRNRNIYDWEEILLAVIDHSTPKRSRV